MTILPAPHTDDYFGQLEPHHFRFATTEEGPVLRLHADDDGRYLGVYIVLEYPNIPDLDTWRIPDADRATVMQWAKSQDEKPF